MTCGNIREGLVKFGNSDKKDRKSGWQSGEDKTGLIEKEEVVEHGTPSLVMGSTKRLERISSVRPWCSKKSMPNMPDGTSAIIKRHVNGRRKPMLRVRERRP